MHDFPLTVVPPPLLQMKLLRGVAASRHVPVVVTLHQPRSEIWHSCLDDVLLFGPNGTVASAPFFDWVYDMYA
jgi:hypothetical protein